MKITFSTKHPYWATILTGLFCTFMTALGSALPQILQLDFNLTYIIMAVFITISALIGIIFMKKSENLKTYFSFRFFTNEANTVLFYIPLILIELLPIFMFGFSGKVLPVQYFLILFFTISVGFNEEIYFRGLSYHYLKSKGLKKMIIFSSALFGMLHVVNILNGKNPLDLVLQIMFAFLVGFIMAELLCMTKSLWILILWHATHDFIAMTTNDSADNLHSLLVLSLQVIILLIYAILLWKKLTHNHNANQAVKQTEIC